MHCVLNRVGVGKMLDVPQSDLERSLKAARRFDSTGNGWDGLPRIERVNRAKKLPLSFAQHRLWSSGLEKMNRAHHVDSTVRLIGELHREALRRALDRIVERHETLRTTFESVDGEPAQRVAEPGERQFELL